MPRTRSLAWSELKVGILAVSATAAAIFFIFMVGGDTGFFWQRYELHTRFNDVQGLKPGAVVRVAGVEVGKVSRVEFIGTEVEVGLQISDGMRDTIRTGARAAIGSLSLLGEATVEISVSANGEPLPDGAFVPSVPTRGELRNVAESATNSLEEATALLQGLREGRGTIGRLFTDESLYQEIHQFVNAAGDVAAKLRSTEGTLGRLVNDPSVYTGLEGSLRNLDAITRRISAGEGSLGRLIQEDDLARSLSGTTANLETVTGRLSRGEGAAGKLMTETELYDRLNSMAGRLDQIAGRLEGGEGTAGRLLQDHALYENMNGAVSELRSLVGDIREDPRRYLQVRVSIF